MTDIKLFELENHAVRELDGTTVALERHLQSTIEANLEVFLGIRFLASEYSTGKTHAGRIDTLGIDENGCPVIVEYKRSTNENVINQGLFYLDWLFDHKAEFELAVLKKFGQSEADAIDWSAPRLVCIASDFTKYDEHAVQQINRNIELIRYRLFDQRLLLFELVNAVVESPKQPAKEKASTDNTQPALAFLDKASEEVKALFSDISDLLLSLGDDVQRKTLKYYFAFKRIKNFACIEVKPNQGTILVYLRVNPDEVELTEGFIRDVRQIGHWGTGDLELTVRSRSDLERGRGLFELAYRRA